MVFWCACSQLHVGWQEQKHFSALFSCKFFKKKFYYTNPQHGIKCNSLIYILYSKPQNPVKMFWMAMMNFTLWGLWSKSASFFKKKKDKIKDSFEAMKCHMVIMFTSPWGTCSFELSVKQPARQCWKVASRTVWTEQKLFIFWLLQFKSCFSSRMPFCYMNCVQSNWKVDFLHL